MATVKIPGIGPVDSKWLYVGGAFVVGIAGYAYWAKSQSESSEVADFTEEDYVYDGSEDEYENPGGSQEEPIEEDYLTTPTTNAEWAQLAVERLSELGFPANKVLYAIGKYLARLTLTQRQAGLIRQIVGLIGPPPVGDFPIKTSPTPEPEEPEEPEKPTKPTPKPPSVNPIFPKPKPPSTQPVGKYVTVTIWPTKKSTLWGIADVEYNDPTRWKQIWNDPKNARLKQVRKQPKYIRPGDRFWVQK